MADDPPLPLSQFSAEVLDNLNVRTSKSNAKLDDLPMFTASARSSGAPPSFDSFPDTFMPRATSATSAMSTPPSASSIPSFSSFQVATLSTRPTTAASPALSARAPEVERAEHKSSSYSKDKSKTRDRSRDDRDRRQSKTSSKDVEDKTGGTRKRDRSRDRSKPDERRRVRSKSRDRDDRHDRDRKDRDKHREDDRHRNDRSRDKGSSRDKDRDIRRDRDDRHARTDYSSAGHGHSSSIIKSSRPHDSSDSPDRKRSRNDGDKDDNQSWSSRRERDREASKAGPSTASQSLNPWQQSKAATGWGERNTQGTQKPGEWVLDVKGDIGNMRYGGLNRSDVPRYTLIGNGQVLGMPSDVRIDFEKSREIGFKQIVMRAKGSSGRFSKPTRYSDIHATWKDQSHEYKRISRAKAEELARKLNLHLEDPSFISLNVRTELLARNKVSKDKEDKNSDNDSEEDGPRRKRVDYRDIHGKSVHKEEDEDLLQTTSDQEEEGAESAIDILIRRRTMLDAELRKNPQQPAKWIEFIAVGDEIDLITSRRSAAAATAHSTGHSEIKLSIFERALESNPTDPNLLLHYMNTCRLCWEPAKVLTKWDDILQSTAVQKSWPGLWIEYLDFRQRHFLSFSVKSFIIVLEDALEKLGLLARATRMEAERTGKEITAEAKALLVKIECIMVHVIARAWTFMKQAGYIERSQAIMQAQVEFLFNMPAGLENEPWYVQVGSLEEYWDSELPRFGEKDAKGWSHYVTEEEEVAMENLLEKTRLPGKDAPSEELMRAFADDDMDRYQYGRWAKVEKELNSMCWFPIRTTEDLPDELDDDPYGIIIFQDIRPFIVPLYSPEARHLFVDCMYSFVGLPLNSLGSSSNPKDMAPRSSQAYNPYFHDGLLLNLGMDIQSSYNMNPGLRRFFPPVVTKAQAVERVMKEIENLNMDLEMEERDWSCVWRVPVKMYPQGADNIFGQLSQCRSTTIQVVYPWSAVTSDEEIQWTNKALIRNMFQQLVEVVPVSKSQREDLRQYYLMYECLESSSSTKGQKLAKKYLKTDRMDLELWNAYAQAEKMLGRVTEARKVYSTVLSMYRSFPAEYQARSPLIYRYFAELEWEQGRPGVALAILLSFAEESEVDLSAPESSLKPSPTRLIKARQFYSQKVARLNLGRPTSGAVGEIVGGGIKWFEPLLDVIVCHAWFEYLSAYVSASNWTTSASTSDAVDGGIKVFEDTIKGLDFRNPDTEIATTTESESFSSGPLLNHVAAVTSATAATAKHKVCVGIEAEMVWIQMAKMVYFHSLQATSSASKSGGGGYQPRHLRRIVHSGLKRFPNCSILQSLFFWTEAKQRIHGRVRTWILDHVSGRTLSTSSSVSRQALLNNNNTGINPSKAPMWVFGLFYELWHQEPYNPNMARTLLESALDSSKSTSFSSSPNLWMIYIELELRESVRQRETTATPSKKDKDIQDKSKSTSKSSSNLLLESSIKVKQLLMRALSDCPWCKDLYLLAFEPRLRNLFTMDELDQMYQTMLEKEIRVRHEIPERAPRPDPLEGEVVMAENSDSD